jgi:hypothetical protein
MENLGGGAVAGGVVGAVGGWRAENERGGAKGEGDRGEPDVIEDRGKEEELRDVWRLGVPEAR